MSKSLDDYIKQAKTLEPLEVKEPGEYNVILRKVEMTRNGSDTRDMIKAVLGFEEKGFLPITEAMVFPIDTDDEGTEDMMLRRIREFCEVFGIDLMVLPKAKKSPELLSEFTGRTATAFVDDDEYQGRPKNVIKRWVQ